MPTEKIEIPEEQANFIRSLLVEGRYRDENEVVRVALQLLEREEAEYQQDLEELRAEVKIGLDAIEEGRYIELNSREDIEALGRDIARRGLERLAKEASHGMDLQASRSRHSVGEFAEDLYDPPASTE